MPPETIIDDTARCRAPEQAVQLKVGGRPCTGLSGRPALRVGDGEVLHCAVQQPVHAEHAANAALLLFQSPNLFGPVLPARRVIEGDPGLQSLGIGTTSNPTPAAVFACCPLPPCPMATTVFSMPCLGRYLKACTQQKQNLGSKLNGMLD